MTAGKLTSAGLYIPRLDELYADMQESARQRLGAGANVALPGPIGAMLAAVAVRLNDLYGLLQILYDSRDADSAEGRLLETVVAFVGLRRLAEGASSVVLTLTGTPGQVIPAGSQARASGGVAWSTLTDATIGVGGTVDVAAEASETGAIEALAGTITTIVTPLSGWDSVTNAEDAIPGRDTETDLQLRNRRDASLSIVGGSTDEAIAADLREIDSVLQAIVISNRSLTTDSLGIPGKAFLAVVWPNTVDPDDIASVIWLSMPAGIQSYGSESATVDDVYGQQETVSWSWATELQLYLSCTVTTGPEYPLDGDDQIIAALVDAYDSLQIGEDVYLVRGVCAAAEIPGVRSVVMRAKFGSAPSVGDTSDLTVPADSLATITSAHITVASS